jgi:hypothetical protein
VPIADINEAPLTFIAVLADIEISCTTPLIVDFPFAATCDLAAMEILPNAFVSFPFAATVADVSNPSAPITPATDFNVVADFPSRLSDPAIAAVPLTLIAPVAAIDNNDVSPLIAA